MKSRQCFLLFIILTLLLTGCSRIRRFLPVRREKVTVSTYSPTPDPKVCVGLAEGLSQPGNVNCFLIPVPEDRTLEKSPLINLYTMLVKHESVTDPLEDPVFIIFDGPGWPISNRQSVLLNHFLDISKKTNRRVVVFDMRAVGETRPELSCYMETPELLVDPSYDWITPCVARLEREAINVEAYNPLEVAHDVMDIARSFGYSQINIWARGYGTSVGLRVAEMYPGLVRSMIVESVDTIFSNLGLPTGFDSALERAFQDCENDEICSSAYPELRQQFSDAYAQLQAAPLKTVFGLLDSDGFVWDVFSLLSEADYQDFVLPLYISSVNQQNVDVINVISTDIRAINKDKYGFSDMLQSVYACSEVINDGSIESIMTQINTNVRPEIYETVKNWLNEDFLPQCNLWPLPSLDLSSGGRISSQAPILLVAGAYDPRFSLESANFAKVTLENSAIISIQGLGRDPLTSYDDCVTSFLSDFFVNPALIPNTECLNFQLSYALEVDPYDPLSDVDVREFHDFDTPNISVTGARPAEWTKIAPGQFLRRKFENDPVGLFHLYEQDQSAEALVSAFFTDQGVSPVLEATQAFTTDNGVIFELARYQASTPEFDLYFDVATYDDSWGGFAIVFKSSNFEYQALHDAVFIPALSAFNFY